MSHSGLAGLTSIANAVMLEDTAADCAFDCTLKAVLCPRNSPP